MNEMRVCTLLLSLTLMLAACSHNPKEIDRRDSDGNFILYVSNQSFANGEIDIQVTIDGTNVVSQDFTVDNQHTWIPFTLNLAKGKHVLIARSVAGKATIIEEFEVSGEHWSVLSYWYTPDYPEPSYRGPLFTYEQSDEPVYFI